AVPRAYANRWLERQFGRGREWGGVLIGLGGMPKPTAADARAILIMAAQAPGSVADQRPQLPAEMLAIPLTSAELFYGLYTLLLLYCPPAIVVGPGGPCALASCEMFSPGCAMQGHYPCCVVFPLWHRGGCARE